MTQVTAHELAAYAVLLGLGATRDEADAVMLDLAHVMIPGTVQAATDQLSASLERIRA